MDCKKLFAYKQNILLHLFHRGCVRLWPRTGRRYAVLGVLWLCVCPSMLAAVRDQRASHFFVPSSIHGIYSHDEIGSVHQGCFITCLFLALTIAWPSFVVWLVGKRRALWHGDVFRKEDSVVFCIYSGFFCHGQARCCWSCAGTTCTEATCSVGVWGCKAFIHGHFGRVGVHWRH